VNDIGDMELKPVITRLETLYERRKKLDEARPGGAVRARKVENIDLDEVLRPRLEIALEEPRAALNYMVWLIGETLYACGGMNLLRQVENAFYEGHDSEFQCRAAFLNARWDGIGEWYA
jgi:hypothetical protein